MKIKEDKIKEIEKTYSEKRRKCKSYFGLELNENCEITSNGKHICDIDNIGHLINELIEFRDSIADTIGIY